MEGVYHARSQIVHEFSEAICRHLSPLWRDYAIAIASAETNIRQVDSDGGQDIGIFQVHIAEVRREGYNLRMLRTNVDYQVLIFKEILARKYRECGARYRSTWLACYHSATPSHHYRYWSIVNNKLERIRGR